MNVLVTGGAAYIGSHAVQRLLRDGHTVVAVDTLFRGHREAMDRLMPTADGRLHFVQADTQPLVLSVCAGVASAVSVYWHADDFIRLMTKRLDRDKQILSAELFPDAEQDSQAA